MANSVFRFDVHFSDAVAVFKKQAGLLIVAALIMLVLSGVTFGILSGPLLAGFLLIAKRLLDNDPQTPTAGDLFKGFELFLPAFLTLLFAGVAIAVAMLLNVIPLIGQIAYFAVCVTAGPVAIWALTLVTYRRMGVVEAYATVFQRIKAGDFWMPLVFALLASIISGAGSLLCGVGVIVTAPFAICLIACGYRDAFGSAA